MNILHYNLGIPPFRSGGLTKYSIDLLLQQKNDNNNVYLLFPGGENLILKKDKIIRENDYRGIKCYKIKNSLPISLLLGIKEPKDFLKKYKREVIKKFFLNEKIEIFHIHTFMGLNKEFLEVAKEIGVKIIYTTHDYFGICPKVNLLDFEFKVCHNFEEGKKCGICNYKSPLTFKLNLLSAGMHKLYKRIKRNIKFKIDSKDFGINNNKLNKIIISEEKSLDYLNLREDFFNKLKLVDKIHYNSQNTRNIFEKYISNIPGEVILISHNSLKKNQNIEKTESKKLRLGYFGTSQRIKGFDYFCSELEKVEPEIQDRIEIYIYGIEKEEVSDISFKNFIFKGKYKQEELCEIYKDIDYTVIPSIWYETFNLVSLESKFYNTPVIISDKIGAKEIFLDKEKIEFTTNRNELKLVLEKVIREKIKLNIKDELDNTLWEVHINNIYELYKSI